MGKWYFMSQSNQKCHNQKIRFHYYHINADIVTSFMSVLGKNIASEIIAWYGYMPVTVNPDITFNGDIAFGHTMMKICPNLLLVIVYLSYPLLNIFSFQKYSNTRRQSYQVVCNITREAK